MKKQPSLKTHQLGTAAHSRSLGRASLFLLCSTCFSLESGDRAGPAQGAKGAVTLGHRDVMGVTHCGLAAQEGDACAVSLPLPYSRGVRLLPFAPKPLRNQGRIYLGCNYQCPGYAGVRNSNALRDQIGAREPCEAAGSQAPGRGVVCGGLDGADPPKGFVELHNTLRGRRKRQRQIIPDHPDEVRSSKKSGIVSLFFAVLVLRSTAVLGMCVLPRP
ncbi:uncharacterized protein [Macaca nemestrina]|uniref:uncharacterized protein isoform X2 n=1 Tax=Macaca nemestrina TaxID=9545 RepID=UPI0039B86050